MIYFYIFEETDILQDFCWYLNHIFFRSNQLGRFVFFTGVKLMGKAMNQGN